MTVIAMSVPIWMDSLILRLKTSISSSPPNGRWARQRGLKRTDGHVQGAETAQQIIEKCLELNIPYLTLYVFSKENWQRPLEEVWFLFDLLARFISRAETSLLVNSVKLILLGEADEIPQPARRILERACKAEPQEKRLTLNLALNYSGSVDRKSVV